MLSRAKTNLKLGKTNYQINKRESTHSIHFMIYSWLSTGIASVNKESFKKFPDPDHGLDRHQNLIVPWATPHPSKKFCSPIMP